MLAAMSGGRGRDVVGDGSVEVAWTTDRSAGFRRPSPGTTVTIELSAHAPKPNRNASSASMPPSAPTEATKGEGGGGDGAAVAEEGVMPTAAAAAEGHPATASFGVAVSITAAIGEADFIAEVEKAFGFHACHVGGAPTSTCLLSSCCRARPLISPSPASTASPIYVM